LQLLGDYAHRPDALFYGIGLDSQKRNESRYAYSRSDIELAFDARVWRSSSARTFVRFRNMDILPGTCCGDPSIARRVADGSLLAPDGTPLPLPPGYGGYRIYTQGAELFLDTRAQRPAPGSGVRIGVHGDYAIDLEQPSLRRWARYGAISEAFWDITGQNRVLHLGVNVQMITAIRGQVPFTELVDLSDTGPLKGFVPGRIIGQSAAAVTLEYEWPIWVWLDGTIHLAAGNAFGPDFAGFELGKARLSTGIGIRAPADLDHAFNFLLAAGTQPLDQGGKIESFRLMFGGMRSF
jgi:hypothetical protein